VKTFDQVTLRTGRLMLRPLREGDADALYTIFSDPRVMRYWSTTPWEAIEIAHDMIARDAEALAAGEHLRLGIERTSDGRLVGTCSIHNLVPTSRRAELGYALAADAWGDAIMNEALTALLDWAFSSLDLNRLEADVDPRNEPSVRCLERLGFRREGHLRERWVVAGEVSDSWLYGLLRREWEAACEGPGR